MSQKINLENVKHAFLSSIIFLLIFFIGANLVNAGTSAMNGLNQTVSQGFLGGAEVSSQSLESSGVVSSIPKVIGRAVGAVLTFLGIGFMILTIYGGFIWMFARGNEQEVVRAKGILEAAAVGLIIVLSAYAITSFIGGSLL